jgi:catechol 2,3-dioxygenase-like lactoylglutathione lyase family enzyme
MNLYAVDHIQLAMPAGEEDRARAFYEGILGLCEVPKPAGLAGRGGAWFVRGVLKVHLGVEADFRPARKAHPAFLVEDLNPLLEKARAAGYEVDMSQPPLEGFRRAHVFDPFGNRIELIERLQAAP